MRQTPVLLYSWQFHDVVYLLRFPEEKCCKRVLRNFWAFFVLLINLFAYLSYMGVTTADTWVVNEMDLVTDPLKMLKLEKWNVRLSNWLGPFEQATVYTSILCCFQSIYFILRTVQLAGQLAKTNEAFEEMKISEPMAIVHSLLVLFQAILVTALLWIQFVIGIDTEQVAIDYFDLIAYSEMFFTLMDILLCALIAIMIHDNWEYLNHESNKAYVMFKDDSTTNSEEEPEEKELSDLSDGGEFELFFATFESKNRRSSEVKSVLTESWIECSNCASVILTADERDILSGSESSWGLLDARVSPRGFMDSGAILTSDVRFSVNIDSESQGEDSPD